MRNLKLTRKELKEPPQFTVGRIKRIAKDLKNERLFNLVDKLGNNIYEILKPF